MSDPDGENPKTIRAPKAAAIDVPVTVNHPRGRPHHSHPSGDPVVQKYLIDRLQTLETKWKNKKMKKAAAKSSVPTASVRDESPPKTVLKRASARPTQPLNAVTSGTYSSKNRLFKLDIGHPAELNALLGEENIQWSGSYEIIGFLFHTTFTAQDFGKVDKIETRPLKHCFQKVA